MARGKLLRVVLPFDENTSSNDQAMAAVGGNPPLTDNGLGSPRVLSQLREQATALRKTVRVKMADEADLRQALSAAKQLQCFCQDIELFARETGMTPAKIVAALD
jgi:hypothetical protein